MTTAKNSFVAVLGQLYELPFYYDDCVYHKVFDRNHRPIIFIGFKEKKGEAIANAFNNLNAAEAKEVTANLLESEGFIFWANTLREENLSKPRPLSAYHCQLCDKPLDKVARGGCGAIYAENRESCRLKRLEVGEVKL